MAISDHSHSAYSAVVIIGEPRTLFVNIVFIKMKLYETNSEERDLRGTLSDYYLRAILLFVIARYSGYFTSV